MSYNFKEIEAKWQTYWRKNQTFKADNPDGNQKPTTEAFYVLDMFPYPSGAGLHVGHPLGYIASDIMARYKRHKGFNVLHPAGYDSFGLPAEQYAIQTGQHPAITTETNIKRYREQLDKIGFSFDWSREVRTSDPKYYRWTQWIFMQIFNSWYDRTQDKARVISELIEIFEKEGNSKVQAETDQEKNFSAEEWQNYSQTQQQEILLKYRLTYLAETEVNWCPGLGTVLANDEIINGVSERGGFPVVRKKMKQWNMRITAFAERLLAELENLDWTDSLKESQRNWIGKSEGASVSFKVLPPAPVLPPTPSRGRGVEFPNKQENKNEGTTSSREGEADYRLTGKSEIIEDLLKKAKEMRNEPTKAEAALWGELRNKKLGHKFRQQHPISKYIVDFICLEKNLIIEVDGKIHQYQLEKDSERELLLKEKKGFQVIRFTNDEVLNNLSDVTAEIKSLLDILPSGKDYNYSEKRTEVLPPGEDLGGDIITTFTTRPDTIFGVSFMTLAPEHELVSKITTLDQKEAVEKYRAKTSKRSERERMADTKTISGVFTGAFAEHPFTKKPIPIWISDYVLAGYGTGAVMAVPAGDERDYKFARHFELPIPNIFEGIDISEESYSDKGNVKFSNSDFLNGLAHKQALKAILIKLEENNLGKAQTTYRLRDAVYSRQRYWGEPFPVYYKNKLPYLIPEASLPLRLPDVEKYLPTEDGQPPLGRAEEWYWDEKNAKVISVEDPNNLEEGIFRLELNTMPGWAGSSWYFFRYMETENRDSVFASEEAMDYWKNVDLYIGGSEHATGHLLYARFWTKFLYDLNISPVEEPFKKLINQGMILGESALVFRLEENSNTYVSANKIGDRKVQPIHVDVSFVNSSNELDMEGFKNWLPEFKNAEFITEESGEFLVDREVEKMSKSKHNVVNPDDICEEYGADSLRLYEMFLGPLEQEKPWNTAGLSGVHNFLRRFWRLYHISNTAQNEENFKVSEEKASPEAMRILHQTIGKVTEDIENFHFNTAISTLMICANELTKLKCHSREILEPLAILIAPFAPHIAEELWERLGHKESVSRAVYPMYDEKFVKETTKTYPISFNGKKRFTLDLPLDLSKEEIEKIVMDDERTKEQLAGRIPKKIIIVPGRIVNIVG